MLNSTRLNRGHYRLAVFCHPELVSGFGRYQWKLPYFTKARC